MYSKERDSTLSSLQLTQWVQEEIGLKKKIPQSLLLGDPTAQNTQKIFFPKCQDTIYITSVFNPYESILSSCIMSL